MIEIHQTLRSIYKKYATRQKRTSRSPLRRWIFQSFHWTRDPSTSTTSSSGSRMQYRWTEVNVGTVPLVCPSARGSSRAFIRANVPSTSATRSSDSQMQSKWPHPQSHYVEQRRSSPSIESMLLNEKDLVRRTSTRHHIVELPAAPQQGARRWKKKHPSEMLLEVLRAMTLLTVRHASESNRGRRST